MSYPTDAVFSAVADGRRRQILELLHTRELTAGQIAAEFDVSWPAISRHLRLLREGGLVRERREGRERVYALEPGALRDVIGEWVAAFDARWDESLQSLKEQLERPASSPTRGTGARRTSKPPRRTR